MKSLQKIVDTAFKELKSKSEPEDPTSKIAKDSEKKTENSSFASETIMSKSNTSRLSDSDATIKSVNLGTSSKVSNKSQQKQMQSKILDFN